MEHNDINFNMSTNNDFYMVTMLQSYVFEQHLEK